MHVYFGYIFKNTLCVTQDTSEFHNFLSEQEHPIATQDTYLQDFTISCQSKNILCATQDTYQEQLQFTCLCKSILCADYMILLHRRTVMLVLQEYPMCHIGCSCTEGQLYWFGKSILCATWDTLALKDSDTRYLLLTGRKAISC